MSERRPTLWGCDPAVRAPGVPVVAAGIIVWGGAWAALGLVWAEAALLGSALVLTPLVLGALSGPRSGERPQEPGGSWRPRYWRVALHAQLPAALALTASYAFEPGWPAALLALPWAIVLLVLTRLGASRLWRRRFRGQAAELAIDGGLLLQIVGGGWIVVHRAGANPYGFSGDLVLLSALHTHLAALVLPTLLGLAGRRLGGPLTGLATTAVLLGFPLVAAGVLFYAPVEWLGACVLGAGGLLVGLLQVRVALAGGSASPVRALLLASSLSLVAGASLAIAFALLPRLGIWWLGRDTMLLWHGALMAGGFGGFGLLAWSWRRPGETY